MKIVSKFNDYYDIGSSMGVDENIVYVRNLEAVELSNSDIPDRRGLFGIEKQNRTLHYLKDVGSKERGYFTRDLKDKVHFIGFCGTIYPFIVERWIPHGGFGEVVKCHYTATKEAVVGLKKTDKFIVINEKDHEEWTQEDEKTLRKLENLLSVRVEEPDLFHRLKTPVFVLPANRSWTSDMLAHKTNANFKDDHRNYDKVFINPCLKDFNFYQVFDSFTAFQEISMFITGVLGENKIPPVQISDVDMRDAKGFNDRSFKKEPTKRRKK